MTDNVFLTLDRTTNDRLKDIPSVISEIFKYSLAAPGFTSNYHESNSTALRGILAKLSDKPDELCAYYEATLQDEVNAYFPNKSLKVQVDYQDVDDEGKYHMSIAFLYPDGTAIIDSKKVLIHDNKIEIIIERK